MSVAIRCTRQLRAVPCIDDRLHIIRKVRALAAGTGDHDHGGIGETLRIRHHAIRILRHCGFRQRPVLRPHAAYRAVSLIRCIEIAQLGICLNSRIVQALEKAYGLIGFVQSTGSASAEHGIGGGPAEDIELRSFRQGQHRILVLKEHDALFGDPDCQIGCFLGSLLLDLAAPADQIQHRTHGTCADQIHAYTDACQRRDEREAPDEPFRRRGQPADGKLDHYGRQDGRAHCDQIRFDRIDDVHHVTHVNG